MRRSGRRTDRREGDESNNDKNGEQRRVPTSIAASTGPAGITTIVVSRQHQTYRMALRSVRSVLLNMVLLRSRSTASGGATKSANINGASKQHAAVMPPQNSIARNFGSGKAVTQASWALAGDKDPRKDKEAYAASPAKKRQRVASSKSDNSRDTAAHASKSPRKRKEPLLKDEKELSRTAVKDTTEASREETKPLLSRKEISEGTTIDYPRLPFHLSDAVAHLRATDVRFHSLLDQVELKPYQELEDGRVRELNLFRTLATSILGQQVSWLAARVIVYRFIRLFFSDLPEKPDFAGKPRDELPFPHPLDVHGADDARLRSAGLSGAKVKYVKDVARRFSDGRLDVRRIVQLEEEQCVQHLVEIKGVGRWTAEMLLMFALRRANILPVGDLGVQKGMLLFFLAGKEGPMIDSKKRKSKGGEEKEAIAPTAAAHAHHDAQERVPSDEKHLSESQLETEARLAGHCEEHATGPPVDGAEIKHEDLSAQHSVQEPPLLPDSIPASLLRSRKDGKKAKGNVYLTPAEMEALTESWHPFRSIGVYLMWSLID